MDFWSLARALATCFFCRQGEKQYVSQNVHIKTGYLFFKTNVRSKTYLGLLSLLEEGLLRLLLCGLVLGEVVRRRHLLESRLVNTTNVNALAGGDHIAGVHPTERDTVDLEGTGNEENTLVEVLEEDDTLATEAAGEENQNGTGLEALADLGGTNRLADLFDKKQFMSELIFFSLFPM